MTQNILALTMGDPAGIGPEITLKALAAQPRDSVFVVCGDLAVIRAAMGNLDLPVRVIDAPKGALPNHVNLIETSFIGKPQTGAVSAMAGKAAFDAIDRAIALALTGQVAGIVTAPIHKESLAAAGHSYPGHTEILADKAGADVAMMLVNDQVRTVLVTIHMALRDAINAAGFDAQCAAIRLAHSGTRALGIAEPRIAVAGLNPHAGEGGRFGDEEITIISPAIKACRAQGINVTGPWPGDTVFMEARQGRFDVVVAQYHDQGLIPIKYMGLETGVNLTLGLPFVRTSPDHGTAFDIAGQGMADPSSMLSAIKLAQQLVAEKTANPA